MSETEMMTSAVARAVSAERERCAKIAETIPMYHSNPDLLNVEKRVSADIAAAIRKSV